MTAKEKIAKSVEQCIKHIRYSIRYSENMSKLRKEFEEAKKNEKEIIIEQVCQERGINSDSIKQIMQAE